MKMGGYAGRSGAAMLLALMRTSALGPLRPQEIN